MDGSQNSIPDSLFARHRSSYLLAGLSTLTFLNCMSWRRNMSILVARRPKVELRNVWPGFKHYE